MKIYRLEKNKAKINCVDGNMIMAKNSTGTDKSGNINNKVHKRKARKKKKRLNPKEEVEKKF